MDAETRKQGESRLESACAELGLQDPRETYRALLRDLRARDADAFARATKHYQDRVEPGLAEGADPIDTWIDYGRVIGGMTDSGRMMAVDASGLAYTYAPPLRTGTIVLYVPDEGTRGSFVAAMTVDPSPAQNATIGLLVEGWLALKG